MGLFLKLGSDNYHPCADQSTWQEIIETRDAAKSTTHLDVAQIMRRFVTDLFTLPSSAIFVGRTTGKAKLQKHDASESTCAQLNL